jgi:hypothetical protein
MSPLQVREEVRNDASKPMLKRPHLLDLACQERFQSRGEVDNPRLIIFGCSWFEAECSGIKVNLSAFEHQNFTLHSPPKGVGNRDGDLELRAEVTAHSLELLPLEKPLSGSSLLRFANYGEPEEFVVLKFSGGNFSIVE